MRYRETALNPQTPPLPSFRFPSLLRPNMPQRLRAMHKIIRISLRHHLPLIRLLHKVLIPLFLRKHDRSLSTLEIQMRALHHIARRLPAHQRVFPSVAFAQDVPVKTPVVAVPVSGLGCGFGGAIDPGR